jgi:hypothetical protein
MNVSSVNLPSRAVTAGRILIVFWLLGWFIKWIFFKIYLFNTIVDYPFLIDSFPPFFRSPHTAQFFYLLPLLTVPALVRNQRFYFHLAAGAMTASAAVLLLHQDTHNDATFVTSFWAGVWFLWFASQMHREEADFFDHARALALCVVGITFWGGFVGKLTPEYWNGQALANIFMEQGYGVIGEWVRANFSEAAIRGYFVWVSKFVIFGECFLAFSPFLPYRLAIFAGIPFMIAISFFTTWRIFSVLFCLMGLLISGWLLKKN